MADPQHPDIAALVEPVARAIFRIAQDELVSKPSREAAERAIAVLRTLARPAEDEEARRLRTALAKINTIRNSIIGNQTINWSEHIYPLVAALEEAGFAGMPYPEARAYFGSLIDRAVKAEDEAARLAREKASAEQERDEARQKLDEFDSCMCGSPMSAHDMGSGHAPVSIYDYRLSQAEDRATCAEQEAARLRETVVASRDRFREYERLHAAKPDMDKARRNAEMAEMCDRALAAAAGAEEPR